MKHNEQNAGSVLIRIMKAYYTHAIVGGRQYAVGSSAGLSVRSTITMHKGGAEESSSYAKGLGSILGNIRKKSNLNLSNNNGI